MERNYFQQRNLNFKDKILSLDFKLIFLVLLLGIISFFAMYSTERGNFDYYTKNHIYRFFTFFIIFFAIGAATALPVPPCSITTLNAYLGCL